MEAEPLGDTATAGGPDRAGSCRGAETGIGSESPVGSPGPGWRGPWQWQQHSIVAGTRALSPRPLIPQAPMLCHYLIGSFTPFYLGGNALFVSRQIHPCIYSDNMVPCHDVLSPDHTLWAEHSTFPHQYFISSDHQ